MGANFTIDSINKTIQGHASDLKGIDVDINDFIDALPILATVACFAKTKTRIYNASNAKNKESNRIQSIALELSKMGANIHEEEDGLTIYPSKLKAATVFSHHDHRIAMSLAVAALKCDGKTLINDIACVSKTFPLFFEEFKRLGAIIQSCA
jgi:3-phosphoshikimate 1-carboxyvinyltransferase